MLPPMRNSVLITYFQQRLKKFLSLAMFVWVLVQLIHRPMQQNISSTKTQTMIHLGLGWPRVRVRVHKRVPLNLGLRNRVKEGKRVQKGTY